ncbi:hypothetical protein PMZ80_006092 [Knufia obscura]|uniref:Cytochrome P450 n=1 Tax=Knufia obscura TaxID=1635080 RepID=A0ABR0RPE1_9EURO|nr:hypothetical protein PMZ80_006092 [Knufia obscura]
MQYWSQGQACFVPSALGDHVVIPPNESEWLFEQTDSAVSDTVNLNNELQAEATIGEPFMVHAPTVRGIITRDLTKNLSALTSDIFDELSTAVDEAWGIDTQEWKEVNPFTTLLGIIARTSNRAYVGPQLCRNEKLIHSALSYSATLFPCSIAIRHVPQPLRPLVSPLITIYNQYHRRTISNIIKPEVERRLAELNIHHSDPEKPSQPRNDFLQWLIEAALKSNNPYDLKPHIITQRMIILQFVTMYPISNSATDALYDIISQPNSASILSVLRNETNDTFAAHNNTWSKRAVNKLHKLDSCLKESLRLAPVVAFGSGRYVLAKGGLTTPLSKTYLPEGCTVAIPSVAIHSDPANYDGPTTYKPFRFAERHEGATTENPSPTNSNIRDSLTATSPLSTSFGHGRFACPGRFFAADQMKMLFAYIIRNYDFEYLPARPGRMWVGPFNVAPMRDKIRVRRREKR